MLKRYTYKILKKIYSKRDTLTPMGRSSNGGSKFGQKIPFEDQKRPKNDPKSPHVSVLKPFRFIVRHLDVKFGLSMLFYH